MHNVEMSQGLATETRNFKFRDEVQKEVMTKMGYLPPDIDKMEADKATDVGNDAYLRWIVDGKAAEFADRYGNLEIGNYEENTPEVIANGIVETMKGLKN